jgi:hypothetical protein
MAEPISALGSEDCGRSEAVKEQPVALIGQARCSGMSFADDVLHQLALRFQVVLPHLNERQRRLMLAQEARLLGHGGVRAVARVAGVSETTVRNGVFELEAGESAARRLCPASRRRP